MGILLAILLAGCSKAAAEGQTYTVVPHLVGLPATTAALEVHLDRLVAVVKPEGAGTVTAQSPAAGKRVASGSMVYLTITPFTHP